MRKNIVRIIYTINILLILLLSYDTNAQNCGCIKGNDWIKIPYVKHGIEISFFYNSKGKFSYGDSDYLQPSFVGQVSYLTWDYLKLDFESSTDSLVFVEFNWDKLLEVAKIDELASRDQTRLPNVIFKKRVKLAKLHKGSNGWNHIIQRKSGKIYIGGYYDVVTNHPVESIKIVDIRIYCYEASNFRGQLLNIFVYLADKN